MQQAEANLDPAALAARFPTDFTWGFGASAYQIEGAANRTAAAPPSGTPSPA